MRNVISRGYIPSGIGSSARRAVNVGLSMQSHSSLALVTLLSSVKCTFLLKKSIKTRVPALENVGAFLGTVSVLNVTMGFVGWIFRIDVSRLIAVMWLWFQFNRFF